MHCYPTHLLVSFHLPSALVTDFQIKGELKQKKTKKTKTDEERERILLWKLLCGWLNNTLYLPFSPLIFTCKGLLQQLIDETQG